MANSGSTTMTSTQIKQLNQMNRASQSVQLGTRIAKMQTLDQYAGVYTITTTDAAASSVTLSSSASAITGFLAEVRSAGSLIYTTNIVTSGSNLILKTSASGTWKISGSEIVYYQVW